MKIVNTTRSAIARLWGRLWATLALACVISLVGTSVASAMDVTFEASLPSAMAASASTPGVDVRAEKADPSGDKQAPTQHCALCCLHACSSLAPASPVLPASPIVGTLLVPARAATLVSDNLSTQDQPPRA